MVFYSSANRRCHLLVRSYMRRGLVSRVALLVNSSCSRRKSQDSTMSSKAPVVWKPLDVNEKFRFNFNSYSIMILNTKIEMKFSTLEHLWEGAALRQTVDGGTDRWLSFLESNSLEKRYPDIITGDLDSVKQETLSACEASGCKVLKTWDQDYNDFEKALFTLWEQPIGIDSVVVVSEGTGRVDQTLSNLNSLRLGNERPGGKVTPIYMISSESLTWYLSPGKHEIHIPRYLRDKQEWCAILPFDPRENKVTTSGLKWNLTDHTIKFGGLISSSNTYSGEEVVVIDTDSAILWSMGL